MAFLIAVIVDHFDASFLSIIVHALLTLVVEVLEFAFFLAWF